MNSSEVPEHRPNVSSAGSASPAALCAEFQREVPAWKDLLQAARLARQQAYAPYSRFAVGAAVLAADGRIVAGCNVENASYGLTICAERAAMCSAIVCGCQSIIAACISLTGPPLPCGACRQFLSEFNPEMWIMLDELRVDHNADEGDQMLPEVVRLSSLLPRAFRLDH